MTNTYRIEDCKPEDIAIAVEGFRRVDDFLWENNSKIKTGFDIVDFCHKLSMQLRITRAFTIDGISKEPAIYECNLQIFEATLRSALAYSQFTNTKTWEMWAGLQEQANNINNIRQKWAARNHHTAEAPNSEAYKEVRHSLSVIGGQLSDTSVLLLSDQSGSAAFACPSEEFDPIAITIVNSTAVREVLGHPLVLVLDGSAPSKSARKVSRPKRKPLLSEKSNSAQLGLI